MAYLHPNNYQSLKGVAIFSFTVTDFQINTSISALKIVESGPRHDSLILSNKLMRKKKFSVVHSSRLFLKICIPKFLKYGSDWKYDTVCEQCHSLKFLIEEHCPY